MGIDIPEELPGICDECMDDLPSSLFASVYVPADSWTGPPPNPLPLTFSGTIFQDPALKWLYMGTFWLGDLWFAMEVRFCRQPGNTVFMGGDGSDIECEECEVIENHCSLPIYCSCGAETCAYTIGLG